MPIRISSDPTGPSAPDNFPGGGRRGGGGRGPGNQLISLLLMLLMRNPKLLIVLLLLGGAYYFFGRSCSAPMMEQVAGYFATGASFDQQLYDAVEVYEPLSDNVRNPLPERVTLEKYAPRRLNQGQQGSCVGWGAGYAARTILYCRATDSDPDASAFSPSFTYNQIKLPGCQGSYIERAMDNLKSVGALPLDRFAYSDEDCNRQPDRLQIQEASSYKIKGAQRLTKSGDDYKVDLLAIKQNLAQGAPVVVGMMVGKSFMQDMMGQKLWVPSREDYSMSGFGGHCMCVIGYDDYFEGGAFQIMNSWGEEWGEQGVAWVRYRDFDYFTKEAYGLYPMGEGRKFAPDEFEASIGIVLNEGEERIPLEVSSGNSCSTVSKIRPGSKFKMEVTNNIECYTYIFGQESDGSVYTLFPYTRKHSPYCGITGARLFPKDHSLWPDSIGSRDRMVVLLSKVPVDYKQIEAALNQETSAALEDRLNKALGTRWMKDFHPANENGNIMIRAKGAEEGAAVLIIDVLK